MSHVEIRPVTGFAVEPWLDELAELRIEVFRDFPYLYEGNREYERRYLDRYAQSDRSVFVLALEFNRLVGAATALRKLDGLVRWALVAAGSAELTLWGWLRRDGLGAAILPTDLPFWIDRLVTALALAGGVGLTGVAVYAVARPPAHQAAS